MGIFMEAMVMPMKIQMASIEHVLCDEPLDWIYHKHEVGIILTADTSSFSIDHGYTDAISAVQRVLDMGGDTHAGTVQPMGPLNNLRKFNKLPADSIASALVGQIMHNGCDDFDF